MSDVETSSVGIVKRRYTRAVANPAAQLLIEGDRLRVPISAFDHAGFRQWVTSAEFPEGTRASFVKGEVFLEMSPEAIESHNKVKSEFTSCLVQCMHDRDLGEVYADGVLLTNIEAELSTEPDLCFASWHTLESGRLRLVEKAQRHDEYVELEGTPDLVVEIVSDSSKRKDLTVLRAAYHRAGIAEYWIVDARGESLRFEILSHTEQGYVARSPEPGLQHSGVLSLSFALERSRNRVGRYSYRLSIVD
jgi:Uma2 family endonuclease